MTLTTTSVQTSRLKVCYHSSGPADGEPVIFLHGNITSGRFWEPTMAALPPRFRAIAPDMRGYGDTEALPIDATRGMRDWSDDLHAFVTALELSSFHLVGWSAGGGVAMQYAIDYPGHIRTLTFSATMSPFGFGGTRDAQGTPTFEDFAGSGGGTASPEFVRRMSEGDRSSDSPNSPRNVMNAFFFKPPFKLPDQQEEVMLTALLQTRTGADFYPGDMSSSSNWPTVAPGTRGMNNAFAPKYCDLSGLADAPSKPPVLWVRGDSDQVISDTSLFDFGFLGQLGAVPGWPGAEIYPPQPMVSQIRHLLERYAANGGRFHETVLKDCGHAPHLEKPDEFVALLSAHLQGS